MKKLKERSKTAGILLNIRKTKILTNTDLKEFKIDDETIDVVE